MIYLQLVYIFFKVGLFGFGGGYAILPMIYQEVQIFGMMSADEFSNLVALSQVTPGPIAINAATYVGFQTAGLLGAIVATIAVSMPSFILIAIAIAFMTKFKENPVVQNILAGIKPATVGLMAGAFIFMAVTAFFHGDDHVVELIKEKGAEAFDYVGIIIFLTIYALIRLSRLGAITLTIVGGVLGVVVTLVFDLVFG